MCFIMGNMRHFLRLDQKLYHKTWANDFWYSYNFVGICCIRGICRCGDFRCALLLPGAVECVFQKQPAEMDWIMCGLCGWRPNNFIWELVLQQIIFLDDIKNYNENVGGRMT